MSAGRIVLVHGFGTSGHVWRRVREALPETLAPDVMGFGNAAAAGREDQTTLDMAASLVPAVRALGGPVTLAGHSMGGKVALLLAATWPELVARVVLVAPSPPTPEPMTEGGRAKLRAAHGDEAALEDQYRDITRVRVPIRDLAQLVQDGVRAHPLAWRAWTDTGSREDVSARLRGLRAPVTVLSSADDPAVTPDTVQGGVLAHLPHADAREVRGSGHFIPLELPDAVVAALLDSRP